MILRRDHARREPLFALNRYAGLAAACLCLLALLFPFSASVAQSMRRAHASTSSCAHRWPCDLGGSFVLGDYLGQHGASRHEVITGTCYSRCTMALIGGACVTPNAELGFHAVTDMFGHVDQVASRTIESLYPVGLRHWIRETGAMRSLEIRTLSGSQAIRLGVPACRPHGTLARLREAPLRR